jgi:putative membrane protein
MRRMLLALMVAAPLLAHEGHAHAPQGWTAAQSWNAATAALLLLMLLAYVAGSIRLRRTTAGRTTLPAWRVAAFLSGWGSAVLALLSPLDRLSDVLFSAHMAQHEILMLVAAPLMVAGRPFIAVVWALGRRARASAGALLRDPAAQHLWDRLTGPFFVVVLHAVVLWAWHVPFLFEAALRSETVHALQHLGFFGTAALFWWALIHGRYGKAGYGVGVFYVFATAMHTQILGALLTFGSRIWYPTHAERTGSAALADQQLAGIVMWIPFGIVFLLVALALFAAWLGEAERRVQFTTASRLTGKSVLLPLLLVALARCSGEQHAHAVPRLEVPRGPVLTAQDRDFLERAAEGNEAEVAIGSLVEERAASGAVLHFGRMMVADHRAANERLASLAVHRGIRLPSSLGDHQAGFDRLVDLRGRDFDREFAKVMVEDHQRAVDLYRSQAANGVDADLRAYAAALLPKIVAHLAQAKELVQSSA